MFPLNLYARVRISLCINAHETAGAARTRSSLRPLFRGGQGICKTSGASRRENEDSCLSSSFRGDAQHRTRNLEIPRCAIAHLRSGPSDHPGMTNLTTDRLVQILPLRILCFDQRDLPCPLPFLYFFFAGDSGDGIVVGFEPNKSCDIVS